MKPNAIPCIPTTPIDPTLPLAKQLDELAQRAAAGDGGAVGAIAVAFRQTLLEIAREYLRKPDAEDVLQDFFVALLEGKAARFPPQPGRAVRWLEGLLRSMAYRRKHDTLPEISLEEVEEPHEDDWLLFDRIVGVDEPARPSRRRRR